MINEIIDNPEINRFFVPILFIIGSLVLGVIIQQIGIGRLGKLAGKTKWKGDEIIIEALGKSVVLWFLLAGIYAALVNITIDPNVQILSQQALLIIFILSLAIVASRITVGLIQVYAEERGRALQATSIISNLLKILIYTMAALIILQTLGISITPVLTALGVGGLAVALALQETLSNLFAGVHMVASKKFKPGDYVMLDTLEEGFITDITWRNTTIKSYAGNLIILPNAKIASATLTNYSRPQSELTLKVTCSVSYNSDLEEVEKVAKEVGRDILGRIKGGVKDYEPFVRFYNFGESGIDLKIFLKAQQHVNQYILKHEFIKALHKRFTEEGIEIPFPQRVVHMKEVED